MELSELYQTMKTAYEEKTGDTIADDGDFGMRMQVVAGELAGLYQQADFVLQQEEIDSVRWMGLEECIRAVKDNSIPNCMFPEELEMVKAAAEKTGASR